MSSNAKLTMFQTPYLNLLLLPNYSVAIGNKINGAIEFLLIDKGERQTVFVLQPFNISSFIFEKHDYFSSSSLIYNYKHFQK